VSAGFVELGRVDPDDPDATRRSLRISGVMIALIGIAVVSFIFWLFTRNLPQLMIPFAVLVAGALDAVSAHATLRDLRLVVDAPREGVAGYDVTYLVRATGLRRPVEVSRPGAWPVWRTPPVVVDSLAPGTLTLTAPPRGIIRSLVFDVVARGPLGLFESARRTRVWLPEPMFIGPPPVAHAVDWPRQLAVRTGDDEIAKVGHDLYRGTRPYVRGDARRSVHWPATAHHGRLMVRETDGLGRVSLRIVVHLPEPGAAAEIAAARAAWLADEAARRGWLVQLVTVGPAGPPPPPPPLRSARGPLPLPTAAGPEFVTQHRVVASRGDVTRTLAAAGYGAPTLEDWQGLTRLVSPWGDEWL
jgi:uncharacterized protein (DUF58 family)